MANLSWWTNRDFTEWKLLGDFSWLKWSMSNLFGGLSTWQIRWTRLSWMIAKFSTRNHDNLRVALYEGVINHHCPLLISTRKNPQPIIGSFMSWSSGHIRIFANAKSFADACRRFFSPVEGWRWISRIFPTQLWWIISRGWPWLYWRKLGG